MIRHDAFLELAAAAIDFPLTGAERGRLERHLAACSACVRDAADLHADARAIATLPAVRLGERRADELLASALHPGVVRAPLRLLAIAALVGLLLVGSLAIGAELLRRANQDDLSVLPVPSAIVNHDASPVADNGVGTRWERVEVPETEATMPGGASMGGVIAGGPGAIAWGFVYGSEPRIWTTNDGRTWERATVPVPDDADPQYQEPGSVSTIVAGGPGYIATGHYYRQGTGRRALIWTSTDGRSWELLPHDPVFENALVYGIVTWQGELLAFGNWSYGPGGGATEAKLWSSSDGLTWRSEQLSLPAGLTMGFAAATTDGLWAIGGAEGDDTGSQPTVILTSTDGRSWSRSPLPRSNGELFAIDGTLLMLVPPWPLPTPDYTPSPPPDGQLSPGLYRATDGEAWEPVSRGFAETGYDLIDVGGTLIVVGDDSAGDPRCLADCQATGWRSIDGGVTWQAVPADVVGGTMTSVAAEPDGTLVAVGLLLDDGGNPSPAAWVSVPSRSPTASPGPSDTPPGSPSPTAAVAASPAVAPSLRPDLVWTRSPDQAALADAGMNAIAVGPDRYVAVGCSTTGEFDASNCSGAAWVSTDGLSWTRGTVPAADHLYLGGVLAAPIGYLAWAYDTGDEPGASFWFSTDGRQWQRATTIPSFSFNHVLGVAWFQDRFVAQSDWNEKRVWVSDDGLTWRDQTDTIGCQFQSGPAGPDPFGDSVHLMVVGDELLRVGTAFMPADPSVDRRAPEYFRVVTRISDGRCTPSTTTSDGWILDVAQTASGFVGVGRQHDPVGSGAGSPPPPIAAWVSPDGASWVTTSLGSKPPNGSLDLVASGDRGILALGDTESGYSQWRSVVGATWSGSKGSLKELSDLVAIPGGFIAVGRETMGSGKVQATVWIAR